ncbi:hypothetical protein B484DRAFT_425945 [Ochromonadaceae sp. CCMP2298]|nr:hypothetical protein B484DRAFT_425945 [Ochromonadaceae sp. CCMP2298]
MVAHGRWRAAGSICWIPWADKQPTKSGQHTSVDTVQHLKQHRRRKFCGSHRGGSVRGLPGPPRSSDEAPSATTSSPSARGARLRRSRLCAFRRNLVRARRERRRRAGLRQM